MIRLYGVRARRAPIGLAHAAKIGYSWRSPPMAPPGAHPITRCLLMRRTPLFALALAVSACTPSVVTRPADGGRAELMAADRAFAAVAGREGMPAWTRAFSADAVRLYMGGMRERGTVVEGREAIAQFDADLFSDPTAKILWAPTDGGAFRDDPRLGWTTGRSWFVRNPGSAAPDTLWRGGYVSLWRKTAGRWEMILDTGALDR